jgi:hypothetical protein
MKKIRKRPRNAEDGRLSFWMSQTYGVRTSIMHEKCQAFETLVICCSTLGARFSPYLTQTLDVTLLHFYFHEGVRESWRSSPFLPTSTSQRLLRLTQIYPDAPFLRQTEYHAQSLPRIYWAIPCAYASTF